MVYVSFHYCCDFHRLATDSWHIAHRRDRGEAMCQMRKQSENILGIIFDLGGIIAVIGALVVFGVLICGIILGGKPGAEVMVYTQKMMAPFLMKIMTIAVFTGLVSLYIKGKHEMNLVVDAPEKIRG